MICLKRKILRKREEKEGTIDMNETTMLLSFIYQNSAMGITTITQLLDIAKEPDFKKHLQSEWEEYASIHKEAKKLLNQHGCDEKGLNSLEKLRTYLMISMQTMTDKSSAHIAEMMITGSNMGILDATKHLKHTKAEPEICNLMKRLLKFEEGNVQQLKKFL